jgi:hypothetical protein
VSRRKRDARPAAPVPFAEATAAATPVDGRFRRRFLIAAAVTAAWWAGLIGMVAFTANPVTINRRQLRNSMQIVTAEVVDAAEGKVKIVKVYSGGGLSGEHRVDGLRELGVRDGATYILPLTLTARGNWQVTPLPDAPRGRAVYPATDDALRQLAEILDAGERP